LGNLKRENFLSFRKEKFFVVSEFLGRLITRICGGSQCAEAPDEEYAAATSQSTSRGGYG
jgi:hypothetical protein